MSKIQILTLTDVIACLESIQGEIDPEYTRHINPPLMFEAVIDGTMGRLGITQIKYAGAVTPALTPGGRAKSEITHELTAVTAYELIATEIYHE